MKRMLKKRKKKKGFTLIELLAVILILGIIALIAIPTVNSVIEQSRKGAAEASMREYIRAVENKIIMMALEGNTLEDGVYTVEELNELGLDIKGSIPKSGKIYIEGQVITKVLISVDNYAVSYSSDDEKIESVRVVVYPDGTPVYFNPETGKKCDNYTEVNSQKEVKSGCMKWYIFLDNDYNDEVTMILDHNTTDKIAWNATGKSLNGPGSSYLNKLKEDTENWSGVEDRVDSYSFSNIAANDEVNNYTINYNGFKARLLTFDEVMKIGNMKYDVKTANEKAQYFLENGIYNNPSLNVGEAKYKWLFDYTSTCTTYGCEHDGEVTKGYWISESVAYSSERAWKISNKGTISPFDGTVNVTSFGIRPVITIKKSIVK